MFCTTEISFTLDCVYTHTDTQNRNRSVVVHRHFLVAVFNFC